MTRKGGGGQGSNNLIVSTTNEGSRGSHRLAQLQKIKGGMKLALQHVRGSLDGAGSELDMGRRGDKTMDPT